MAEIDCQGLNLSLMNQFAQIIFTSIAQAFLELRANKLRTFLSLLGISIGIFCIIGVLTVLDSLENNIHDSMASLGDDVIYINRQPWMPEGEDYKWWEYLQRKPMGQRELDAVTQNAAGVKYAALSSRDNVNVKYLNQEVESVGSYAITNDFDKIQNVDVEAGRYLSGAEIDGGNFSVVIGADLAKALFTGDPLNKQITFLSRKFTVVGVMKKSGRNMAGFNFDNAVIYPYNTAKGLMNLASTDWSNDPMLMVKAGDINVQDMRYQVEGILRVVRKVKPNEKNNFSVNQLSQVSASMDAIFSSINAIGAVIGGFSLIVGAFGIANIMFVTVKERTRIIGLKKAIGARSRSILTEFLIEAITLCIAGGLVGIIIVFLLSLLLTYGADFPVTFSLKNFFIGISISAVVGVLAGFIPARSASKLDPVVAIRSN
jgi:putative ABC transport system permease protein